MISHDIFLYIACIAAGVLIGAGAVRIAFRRARLTRNADNTCSLRLPLWGSTVLAVSSRAPGVVIDEVFEIRERLEKLRKFIDTEVMLRYAKEFRINYVGTEGDRDDGGWSPGRLAYCTVSSGCKGGYEVYLNPGLDLQSVASCLSRDLKTTILPEEVYPFLYLHEVGHTAQAGNQDFYTAVVNYALSGGRRSPKRRRELKKLKCDIECFADRFALRELRRWRESAALQRRSSPQAGRSG
ncbi:MAG: hypothetical protein AB1805_05315 [Nitrospirota bacterium]